MSIFNSLEKLNIELKVLPRIDEINGKKISIDNFSNISIDEILQREEIPPLLKLLEKYI